MRVPGVGVGSRVKGETRGEEWESRVGAQKSELVVDILNITKCSCDATDNLYLMIIHVRQKLPRGLSGG
jgi:hypothetical protein